MRLKLDLLPSTECEFTLATQIKTVFFKQLSYIFSLVSILTILMTQIDIAQSQERCVDLFANSRSTTKKSSGLEKLAHAMTHGQIPEDAQSNPEIFEIYRQSFMGDPKSEYIGRHTSREVLEILKANPELQKPHFTEYTISSLEKIYQCPEALASYIKSLTKTAGQIKSNLFQIEANFGYWKKILDYKDTMSESLAKEANSENPEDHSQKFLNYLNRIISKKNRNFLFEIKDENVTYRNKIYILFKTLKYVQEWMQQQGKDTHAIRQAIVDLVASAGFHNQHTIILLKSRNPLHQIVGLRKILDEQNEIAIFLGYKQGFSELVSVFKPKAKQIYQIDDSIVDKFEKLVLQTDFITEESEPIRIRSLSILESPFRSCLGKECSTQKYFDKALDPNFIYFTMTNSKFESEGLLTAILGTAKNSQGQDIKVAFIDKLQNVPIHIIPQFLEAIRKSVEEKGYLLGLPENVGDHNDLSNDSGIRYFVESDLNSNLKDSLTKFVPHQHNFRFNSGFSRADHRPNLKILTAKSFEDLVIKQGEKYGTSYLSKDVQKEVFIEDFSSLRNSSDENARLRYIKSRSLVKELQRKGLYHETDFNADLENFIKNRAETIKVRKEAFYELLMLDLKYLQLLFENFTETEIKIIASDLKDWKNSNNKEKQNIAKQYGNQVFERFSKQKDNINFFKNVMTSGLFDLNSKNSSDQTLIHMALFQDSPIEVIVFLMQQKSLKLAELDPDIQGKIFVHLIEQTDNLYLIRQLMTSPTINLNATNFKTESAILTATYRAGETGNLEILTELIRSKRFNINADILVGKTALQIATEKGWFNVVELLKKNGAQ